MAPVSIHLIRLERPADGPVELYFDSGESLRLPARVCRELELEEGQSIDPETLRRDPEKRGREILLEAARRHLSRYPKTTERFRDHFRRKGYPSGWLDGIIPRLRREGYLDDEAAARSRLRQLEGKGYGPERLVSELVDRGIDYEEARSLAREACPPEEARRRAHRYARRNRSLAPRRMARRLRSRGFSSSLVRECVREHAEGESGGTG